ncbi:MAG: hypothetical protein M3Q52_10400 [Pseudomonadota bacterium]|nr:hypothetical protein [Pseudomonadota bacterium]
MAPHSDRLVIGAELGGEQRMYLLKFDQRQGLLRFDDTLASARGEPGYIDLETQAWPHGASGPAWAHAALVVNRH